MKSTIFLLITFSLVLSACSPATATPTQAVVAPTSSPTPAPSATLVLPTSTPLPPSATPKPSATPLPPLPSRFDQPVLQPAAPLSAANAGSVVELARWGSGRAESVSWSPDGARLAVQTPMGAYLFDAEKPALPTYVEGNITFSPNGGLLAVAQGTGRAERTAVYAFNGAALATEPLYTRTAARPVFSPDGLFLALTAPEGVLLLEAGTGKQAFAFEHKEVEHLVFSPDGALLFSAGRDSLAAWKVKDGGLLKRLEFGRFVRLIFSADGSLALLQNRTRQNEPVVDILSVKDMSAKGTVKTSGTFVLSPDASRMYAFSNFPTPGKVEVFSLPDGAALPGMRVEGSIYRMVVSPDGKTLVVSVPDPELGVVKLLDVATGKTRLSQICEHSCDAQMPHFSPDGKILALYGHNPMTGGDAGVVVLYEAATGKLLRRLLTPRNVKSTIERIAFSKNGERVAVLTGRSDDAVRIWETASGKVLHTLEWAPQTVNLGALSPDGKLVAVSSDSPTTRLLQARDGKVLRQLENVGFPIFSADGTLLAGAEFANARADAIRLWKTSSGEPAATFGKQLRPPLALAPAGDLGAVMAGFSVQLLRIPSGQFVSALTATERPNVRLQVVQFSPDGKLLAAGDEGGLVWAWQVETRKLLYVKEGHKKDISALTFSADGKTLVSLAQDGGVRFWQAEDGKLLRSVEAAGLISKLPAMEGSTFGLASGLALSPDGKLLAVGGFLNPQQAPPGKAGVTLLVEIESGGLVRMLRGGGGRSSFAPDGMTLYTSGDGAVRVWGALP